MNGAILLVSDTPICGPFGPEAGSEKAPSSSRDDAIRARLADVARQEEKRRRLSAFFERETPAWNPDDHPEIDAAGGAAAWVRKLRSEAEQGFEKRTRRDQEQE
jgi:hypothetical protein